MDVTKRPTDSTASTKSEQTDATSRQTSTTSGQKSTTCRQNIKSTKEYYLEYLYIHPDFRIC